nr:hypothetical protein [Tanacetum cinerariifolium]
IPPALAGSWEHVPKLSILITPIKQVQDQSFGTVQFAIKPVENSIKGRAM